MAETHRHQQELTQSLKAAQSQGNGVYGSADDGSDEIIVNKTSSRFNSKCLFQWVPLIFSTAALIIAIILATSFVNTQSTADDAMNLAASSKTSIGHLSRNFILSQFAMEQRIRSEGDSGITNTRQHTDGDSIYDDGTYSNGAISAIHDHADFINVAGMGEVEAILNGVEFQTRHNDYNLVMPSTTSDVYGETEPIPMPDIPPEVSAYGDIDGQIAEMQEWFRAFKTQNKSHRYYPDYFKPILCYLEGTWIIDEGILEEPFDSDRHSIDASTWKELHDKLRYMVNAGRKDPFENLAHLPSSIRNLIDDVYPVISNWEYRIVCSPLHNDVPTARFRVANDLSVQLLHSPLRRDELYYSRRARFELARYINLTDPDGDESYPNGYFLPGSKEWNYLDYLMEQVPGKDNYQADLIDELPGGVDRTVHYVDGSHINSEDAMGTTRHRRSYSDRYQFGAKTTQTMVSPISMIWETPEGKVEVESRWSYAVPLEIIYTTPIVNWNPHNIPYNENLTYNFRDDPSIGSCTENNPYEGWHAFNAYYTPAGFFESRGEVTGADTPKLDRCALDTGGNMHPVWPAGHWITFPSIGGGVGYVRQRFPIPPIHAGGHSAFKDLKALQDILLDDEYDDAINGVDFFGDGRDRIYGFDLSLQGGGHEHILNIPGWMVNTLWFDSDTDQYYNGSDYSIVSRTDTANGHTHTIIAYRWRSDQQSEWNYIVQQCKFGAENDPGEYMDNECADGHTSLVRGWGV